MSYDRRGARRLAAWVGDLVVDLPDAVGHPAFPDTLESLLAGNGGTTLEAARAALSYPGALREFAVPRARMLAPLALSSDEHTPVLEPGDHLPSAPRGMELVCRPQLAGIVGRAGPNLDEGTAREALFGYTLVNDWDLRRPGERELMPIGTSVGPCVVTADQFDPSREIVTVSIDGMKVCETRLGTAVARRFARTIARASARGGVNPGEIYGLSLFPSPIPVPVPRRAKAGSTQRSVAVEVAGIGRLENALAPATR